ncbi:MAG: glycosyltransferase [Thermodesulfovibrionales bacterium]
MNAQEKIRLLYFHPTIVFGGAERTTVTLLEKLDKSIFDVLFITKKGIFHPLPVERVMYIDDLGIHDGFEGIGSLVKDTKIMLQLINKERPDIVFGMLHYACIILSLMKIRLRDRVRIIISPRTPSKDAINFYFKDNMKKRLVWNFMVRFFCRYSDRIVVASEGIKEECITEYKAERKKVVTINNSVDAQSVGRFSVESIDEESSPDHFVISTAGRLSAEKNIAVLLNAFALMRRDLKAKLWIVGDGPERPHLKSLAASLNIMDDIVFWGFQENLYKFIKKSDIFVHTSLFEGFGNIILEAMACGVPVIATNCPFGPREIINNGENGILVPVSDEGALAKALKMVLENKEARKRFVENAYKRLSEFTPERMVRSYENVFLSIAHSNGPLRSKELREDSILL